LILFKGKRNRLKNPRCKKYLLGISMKLRSGVFEFELSGLNWPMALAINTDFHIAETA
jgi:hypothetical protein